jgi:hypothetical protein
MAQEASFAADARTPAAAARPAATLRSMSSVVVLQALTLTRIARLPYSVAVEGTSASWRAVCGNCSPPGSAASRLDPEGPTDTSQ